MRRAGVYGLVLLTAALTIPAAAAQVPPPAAPPPAGPPCRNGFFLVQGSSLLRFDERGARYLLVARLPVHVDALAYIERDHRFYGIAGSRVVTVTTGGAVTEQEAEALVEAHWVASMLATDDRSAVQSLIIDYLNEASGAEWRSLRDHRTGTAEGDLLFTQLRERIAVVKPTTDQEVAAQQQLLGFASQAATAPRMSRIGTAAEGTPPLLWWTLILGGVVSVLFLYLYGLEPTLPNGVMLALLGGMLALLLFVIYHVEYPFSRGFAVGPGSLRDATTQPTR